MTARTKASPPRRPATFRLDDPAVVLVQPGQEHAAGAGDTPRGRATVLLAPEPLETELTLPAPPSSRRKFPWGTLFWSALGSLVSLAFGLALTRLIEDLYTRAQWLGWAGLVLALALALALLVVLTREALGLMRLSAVNKIRNRAATAIVSDNRDDARSIIRDVLALSRSQPRLSRARATMHAHLADIIDGADLLRLAERELMAPLDAEARKLVGTAAKRVSVVTAVSPRAAVDLAFVLFTAVSLVRRLAELYGGRPGALGLIRLMRLVIAHLAVTGGMAAGDSLIQQVLGHGVAAKLSARLGEGVLNGLLTARLGLAAIEVARPLPFTALPRPTLADLTGDLFRRGDKQQKAEVEM